MDNTFPPMSSEEHRKVAVHFQSFDTTSLNLNLFVLGNDYNKMKSTLELLFKWDVLLNSGQTYTKIFIDKLQIVFQNFCFTGS